MMQQPETMMHSSSTALTTEGESSSQGKPALFWMFSLCSTNGYPIC